MIFTLSISFETLTAYINAKNSLPLYMVMLSLTSVVSMLVPSFICTKVLCKNSNKNFRQKHKPDTVGCFVTVMFGFGCCSILNFARGIICSLLGCFDNSSGNYFGTEFSVLPLTVLSLAVVPALCEEFTFRGNIFGILSHYGEMFAAIVSSLFFGLLHSSFSAAIFAFFCGIILSLVRKESGRLAPSIAVHILNNLLALSVNTAAQFLSKETYINFLFVVLIISVIMTTVSTFILKRRKKDLFNFKETDCKIGIKTTVSLLCRSPLFIVFVFITLIRNLL